MTISIWGAVAAFVAAMGIPSAVMGLVVWRLERRIDRHDKALEEKNEAQKELVLILIKGTRASIALGEATAKAVQRIPDAHCNGDMHAALEYATGVKHEQKDFLARQGVNALLDD